MKCCVMRKVVYRMPKTNRLVWGVVLHEREGLSFVFINKPDDNYSHTLAICVENVAEHVFEDVNASQLPLEKEDLAAIGSKLQALGDGLSEAEFKKFFDAGGLSGENDW